MKKILTILCLLFTVIGYAEYKYITIYEQRAYERYHEACNKGNMPQTQLNFCSFEIEDEIDKEIIELSKNSEDFSLEGFKQWAQEAMAQKYPCQTLTEENSDCSELLSYGSIQPLSNALLYIEKGEEYKDLIENGK